MSWQKSKLFLRNLNLFASVPPSTEEHELRTQRISTRVFITLLIVSMTILLFYTSLVRVTKTIDVPTPTLEKYSELYSTYSQRLTCACSKISINYDTFLKVQYTQHQVCSSIFVTKEWIDYLAMHKEAEIFSEDFRKTSPFAFHTVRTLCQLINGTISNSLIQFYSNQFVSTSVVPSELFEIQSQSLTDQLKLSTTNTFLLSLSTIRDTTKRNILLSGLQTNQRLYVSRKTSETLTTSRIYGNCSCTSTSTCVLQSSIYQRFPTTRLLFNVTDFYAGCYLVESLLRSSLQCFYNQSCMNRLQSYLKPFSVMNARALDSSLPSHYFPNSTIQKLVDNLMIEDWNLTKMYDRYYNECQPTQCTYTLETRNDIIYIVTTLIGTGGGVMTVLELVVPRLVKLVMYIIRKLKRVIPEVSIAPT